MSRASKTASMPIAEWEEEALDAAWDRIDQEEAAKKKPVFAARQKTAAAGRAKAIKEGAGDKEEAHQQAHSLIAKAEAKGSKVSDGAAYYLAHEAARGKQEDADPFGDEQSSHMERADLKAFVGTVLMMVGGSELLDKFKASCLSGELAAYLSCQAEQIVSRPLQSGAIKIESAKYVENLLKD